MNKKKDILAQSSSSTLTIWKVLYRAKGDRVWRHAKAASERDAQELADAFRAQGLEVGHVTRL